MKTLKSYLPVYRRMLLTAILLTPFLLMAAGNWPKEIKTDKAVVIIYQPQPDSLVDDHLYSRAAVSLKTPATPTPVFGAVWTDAKFSTDRESGICTIYNVIIQNVRFPGMDTVDPVKVQNFKNLLEEESAKWTLEFSLDELKATLDMSHVVLSTAANLNNDPPEIIYVKKNSILLLFDGDPVYKDIENAGLKRAINTPFLVLQDLSDKHYYLYGGERWYRSSDPVSSAWAVIQKPPASVLKYQDILQKETSTSGSSTQQQSTRKKSDSKKAPPDIVVRTRPAELIQSDGEPEYAPIQGTQLLYVTNTDNNIFMDIDKNQYYILISGRWYTSPALTGSWSYVASDKLPQDFARIPEGSEKDAVLASVAGTNAAKEAVMDAQIPQTAAVDRKTAQCEVKWDGEPKFEKIKGTDLARGMNTGSTVLLYRDIYYVCDNAVWFIGKGPEGPWEVATGIPDEVQKIPPEDPTYNVKYVYIYDVEPEVVYVGYTPGYTGCYVYGPTVVYGTGWYYPPFYGPYYYPRPVTYGFSMNYNPWYGWSMGFTMSMGWFSFTIGGSMGYPYGWWGPPIYRPPFYPPYYGFYGPRPVPYYRGGGNTIIINNNRNIYTDRPDRSARPSQQPAMSNRPATGDRTGTGRPSTQPSTKPGTRDVKATGRVAEQKNNVYTDNKGEVYRNNKGSWEKNNGKDWESVHSTRQNRTTDTQPSAQDPSGSFNRQEFDRQSEARQRGTQQSYNRSTYQRSASGSYGSGGARMSSGSRMGGGGGGYRR